MDNLLDDKSKTQAKDESVDVPETTDGNDEREIEDSETESGRDVSALSHSYDSKPKEKKAAWIDEDDYHYT